MKYFIYLNSKKISFKSTNPSFISPTIKKIFSKNSIDLLEYLEKMGLKAQRCAICKSSYNPYFTLDFEILPDGEVKIVDIIHGHKSYNYQKYNKNYCYGSNPKCPGIKMNSNSVEFISLTLNLTTDDAIKYIHDNNKSPFYVKNHSTLEEYSTFQSRSKEYFIKRHGEKDGSAKYDALCSKYRYTNSKTFYLDKFGSVEGTKLWDEISKKKAITLANMARVHGEDLGKLKLANWKATVSKTNSKYIQEFGIVDGLKKIENRNSKRLNTLAEHGKMVIPAELKIDYLIYHHLVLEETKYQLLLYGHLKFGKNWQTVKKQNKLEIDHQFSIKSGFINGISPNIIGNIENLDLLTRIENTKKRDKNSIDHTTLLEKIVNSKYGK